MTEYRTNIHVATLEKRKSDAKFRTYNKQGESHYNIAYNKGNKQAFQIEAHGVCEVRGGVELYLGAYSS
jgi:hypothetical protein